MKLIEPSHSILNIEDLEKIELAARTCYKSNVNEITRKSFLKSLIRKGHESVLEHSCLIFKVGILLWFRILLCNPKYLNLTCSGFRFLISGNVRSFRDFYKEHNFIYKLIKQASIRYEPCFDDLIDKHINTWHKSKLVNYTYLITYKEKLIHIRKTVKFIVNRGVTHELVRHRECSFSQESTRFCNYTTDKFGGNITFILPNWFITKVPLIEYKYDNKPSFDNISEHLWFQNILRCEERYFDLIADGRWTPQLARDILPNALKSEIIVTTNLKEWNLIFKQRTSKFAHPQMVEVMIPLYREMKGIFGNIIENIEL